MGGSILHTPPPFGKYATGMEITRRIFAKQIKKSTYLYNVHDINGLFILSGLESPSSPSSDVCFGRPEILASQSNYHSENMFVSHRKRKPMYK